MNALKIVLSALASIAGTLLGPGLIYFSYQIGTQRQTGIGAVAGGLTEALFSLRFWILAAILFYLFFGASRLSSKALRVLLFWTPTLFITALGVCVIVLILYARIHARQLAGR